MVGSKPNAARMSDTKKPREKRKHGDPEPEHRLLEPDASHLFVARANRLAAQRVEHLVERQRRHDHERGDHVRKSAGSEVIAGRVLAARVVAHHHAVRGRHRHTAEIRHPHRPAEAPDLGELAAARVGARASSAGSSGRAERLSAVVVGDMDSSRQLRDSLAPSRRPRRASRERRRLGIRPNDTRRRRRGEGFLESRFPPRGGRRVASTEVSGRAVWDRDDSARRLGSRRADGGGRARVGRARGTARRTWGRDPRRQRPRAAFRPGTNRRAVVQGRRRRRG